ncbi:hypothetical protein [Thermobispora bispora]|uniref:hypothetical protein n=1 Tax=Thermobispora bispora TaxID=2006 RepID=UPI00197F9647|nr:hypothetical protein [Thermobispora bispora]QSI49918.1 hypothetical protein CYL17_18225 [Thermobispora bispora]QSI50020.1 hypothetical protein CYL17_18795 [Thermobispora bispora]
MNHAPSATLAEINRRAERTRNAVTLAEHLIATIRTNLDHGPGAAAAEVRRLHSVVAELYADLEAWRALNQMTPLVGNHDKPEDHQ